MNAQARKALVKIVEKYGEAVAGNLLQLRGLLCDFSPGHTREIRWLVTAAEEGVPHALTNAAGPVLTAEARVQQQTLRFVQATGLDAKVARWTVESWALALGVIRSGQTGCAEFQADEAQFAQKCARIQRIQGNPLIPDGFRAVPFAAFEPYTNTGWANGVIHNRTGIEMVYVPAGVFMMGSSVSEQERRNDERWHRVTLTTGFFLGRFPVTQEQWEMVMFRNPSLYERSGKNAPVEQVSWDDCQKFCRELGDAFRLPTEAEWEYACRAGTTGPYAGDLDAMGWYADNSGNERLDARTILEEKGMEIFEHRVWNNCCRTHPVGCKQPNGWGLYDMHGHVWEWCQDWYGQYPARPVTDPTGPTSDSYRVCRGGSWNCYARYCRSAVRYRLGPGNRFPFLGLRVLRTVPA